MPRGHEHDQIFSLSIYIYTVEPPFNEPSFNEVLDVTNDILCPSQVVVKCME